MAEALYQSLAAAQRREALQVAARRTGHGTYLLEKDTWVVATLRALFEAPFGRHLVFKGGTSLSKVWKAIRRFSEDIDITYDIREFAPDLVVGGDDEALPPTRSQERRWTRAIRPRLAEWVREVAHPLVEEELGRSGFPARVRAEAERLYVAYEPLFVPLGPMRPDVQVDFGARSTGEPHVVRTVVCDAATHLPGLGFPEARPAVMLAERTFWEKATSMHVYCLQGRVRGERWSRHWHDLVRLDDAGIASRALADRELAQSVARHKAMFFRENDSNRQRIDYHAAVSGNSSGWFRREPPRRHLPKTTPACSPSECCWTMIGRSTRSWSGAPSSRSGPTRTAEQVLCPRWLGCSPEPAASTFGTPETVHSTPPTREASNS